MPKNSESKNGVEDEKQAIDLDAQMKMIENQIAELSGQYKFLQSMKEQGVEPDVVTYSSMINVFQNQSEGDWVETAIMYFEQMKK